MIDSQNSSLATFVANSATASVGKTAPATVSTRQIEDFYATLLNQFGQNGYASASPVENQLVNENTIQQTWDNWFAQIGIQNYSFQAGHENPSVRADKSADDLKQDYGHILVDAYQNGAYADPVRYVQSLNKDQLQVIQQVHHLAESIEPQNLSRESSLNLLLPPPSQIDVDHDGLTAVGAAYMLQFPNSDTPSDVRDAWDRATADLDESDRLTYSLQMCFPLIAANLRTDTSGNFVRAIQPGDSDWTNPMAAQDFSYAEYSDKWLNYLREFRSQLDPVQYDRDTKFWTNFREQLASNHRN